MGAISGVSDVDAPEVAGLLVKGMLHFSPGNRALAIDALLRTEARTTALIEALERKELKPADLTEKQIEALRNLKNERLKVRVQRLLSQKVAPAQRELVGNWLWSAGDRQRNDPCEPCGTHANTSHSRYVL
jgi:hypothetical protein